MNIKIIKENPLLISAVIVTLMLFFPPFYIEARGNVFSMGYSFIFYPPILSREIVGLVNVNLLIVQCFIVIFTVPVFTFSLHKKVAHENLELKSQVKNLMDELGDEREKCSELLKGKEKIKSPVRRKSREEIII